MIHAYLIAAVTADGFIARDEKHASFGWNSKEDKKRFIELTRRAGVVVMGSTTFATIPGLLKERTTIVYSRSKTFEGAETTQKTPLELLKELEGRGFKEVAICGGSKIYTMFMKANVIERVFLTIEPLMFGKGITLFNEELQHKLILVSASQGENGALLLEYKVDYSGTMKMN